MSSTAVAAAAPCADDARPSCRSRGQQLRGWRSRPLPASARCRGWRGVDQYVKIESDATHPAVPPVRSSIRPPSVLTLYIPLSRSRSRPTAESFSPSASYMNSPKLYCVHVVQPNVDEFLTVRLTDLHNIFSKVQKKYISKLKEIKFFFST